MNKKKFSIKERIRSFGFAYNGIKRLIVEEHNARIHVLGAIVAIILGIVLEITVAEWLWVALAIALVFITEMINTAIEAICDEVTKERRPTIKKAKDVAAGAVLVAAMFAVAVAVWIFIINRL